MLRVLVTVLTICIVSPAYAADLPKLTMEGKKIMKSFGKALKGELVAAMKSGGPVKAMSVCNLKAPAITAAASASSGWTVARSSHKLRNPNNKPDAFTLAAINEFLARQAKGESSFKLIKTAIVSQNGKRVFRLVKAIPTLGVCLKCHGGKQVKPAVKQMLQKLYPTDQALGFRPGQMRGVFTLSKIIK